MDLQMRGDTFQQQRTKRTGAPPVAVSYVDAARALRAADRKGAVSRSQARLGSGLGGRDTGRGSAPQR